MNEFFGHDFFDEFLDVLSDEASTLFWREAFFCDEIGDSGRIAERDSSALQSHGESSHFELGDVEDRGFGESIEYEGVVETGEEFWSHLFLELEEDFSFDGIELFLDTVFINMFVKADFRGLSKGGGTDVGRQDNQSVFEAHFAALCVS